MGCCLGTEETFEGKYVLENSQVLGTGGFAKVQKVKLRKKNKDSNKQYYAVKIVDASKLSKKMKELILTEVSIMKELTHKNIIKCYDFYEKPQEYLIVMELMEGGELFDKIAQRDKHTELEARMVMSDIFNAISYMHSMGVMHRDLKPENLLLSHKDESAAYIKIADFGFAKHVTGEEYSDICGTPDYIAPEMISKQPYGVSVDIWSIGVILYVLLCGYAPFQEQNTKDLFEKIKKGQFTFHSQYWSNVSDLAKDLIKKMLVLSPKDRITAGDVLKHPWMNAENSSLLKYGMTPENLKYFRRYNARRKIMRAARAVIAINKMTKLVFEKRKTEDNTMNPIITVPGFVTVS